MSTAVIQFPGTNCEQDVVEAITTLGGEAEIVWHRETDLSGFDGVVLPGGFAHGDYLRTGAIARFSPVMAEVARMARKWKHAHGIDLLLVDYVHRVQDDGKDSPRWERVGNVARGLKNLARDVDIPVVALAQVNRAVDQRADQRPHMGDLADSSELEKEADSIIMLYRDEVARPDAADCQRGIAELLLEKNRHGPTGRVRMAYLASSMGLATAFLAQNIVYGNYWEVDPSEAFEPEMTEEKWPKGEYFIIDVQGYYK